MTKMLESSDKDIKAILIKYSNMFEIKEKKVSEVKVSANKYILKNQMGT